MVLLIIFRGFLKISLGFHPGHKRLLISGKHSFSKDIFHFKIPDSQNTWKEKKKKKKKKKKTNLKKISSGLFLLNIAISTLNLRKTENSTFIFHFFCLAEYYFVLLEIMRNSIIMEKSCCVID